MATTTKRWAVRDETWGGHYRLYVGDRPPRKNRRGEWPHSSATRMPIGAMRGELFESIFPVRLKPGGGPVKIECKACDG